MASTARPRAGYLGPEGTFSEEALLASAIPGAVQPVPLTSIYEVVMQLRAGELEWAIVPIENSLDGSVSVTLDLLAEEADQLQIVAEALLRVRHSLIASAPVELGEIDTVLSHPQVPGQCERFLRHELAHARILPAASTAEAVRTVTSQARRGQAALGTLLAADIYRGTVIREGVQDSEDNETRFVWLARAHDEVAPPLNAAVAWDWKTSLVFWGPGAERPPRHQPDEDRVSAAPPAPWQLHVLRRPQRQRARAPSRRGDRRTARAVRGGEGARLLPARTRRGRRRAGGVAGPLIDREMAAPR